MSAQEKQRDRLTRVIGWAEKMLRQLGPIMQEHGHKVHFRPSANGVTMVGLLPERPQRGLSRQQDLQQMAKDFDALFARNCVDIEQGRVTPEKRLQSYLISQAYQNDRHLVPFETAASSSDRPVELMFVTDELALPAEAGRAVCDVLGWRPQGPGAGCPVVIELKSARQMKRLVKQVNGYAELVDANAELFAALYSTLLGEQLTFTGKCERWLCWPLAGDDGDPRAEVLANDGIRVIGYADDGAGGFRFRCD